MKRLDTAKPVIADTMNGLRNFKLAGGQPEIQRSEETSSPQSQYQIICIKVLLGIAKAVIAGGPR